MPLISRVGARTHSTRLLFAVVYGALCLGAITIIYPFGLMLSTSTRSNADATVLAIWPAYLTDDWELFRKYIVEKDPVAELAMQYGHDDWKMPADVQAAQLRELVGTLSARQLTNISEDWMQFLKTCPEQFKLPSFCWTRDRDYSVLGMRRDYQQWLETKYHQINALNEAHGDTARSFTEIAAPFQDPLSRRWVPPATAAYKDWLQFLRAQDPHRLKVATLESYLAGYLTRHYFTLDRINEHCGTAYQSVSQIRWDDLLEGAINLPATERERIIRQTPLLYVEIEDSQRVREAWVAHLQNESSRFGPGAGVELTAFSKTIPVNNTTAQAVWSRFIEVGCPLDEIRFRSPLKLYQSMLLQKYGDLRGINAAYETIYSTVAEIRLPYPVIDYAHFRGNESGLRWTFLWRNYGMVLEHVALRGRALWVTIALVGLSVAGALTVNPAAAYALSRYPLSYTHSLLVFFLATMAFPASVTMIPAFLLMKDLSLLNTLWALVLPSLASGYSIFLLKGFFDSLPLELFESAMIEGASEPRMFWSITLPMCKPILAVIALGAFTASYGSFMFAFLTCQDPDWWTIMVFLYEFQQTYSLPLVMASLVVASVPTLVVFLLCQNIILRGIVVPSFK
jgi:multiple sugar transport system permease protein